MTNFYSIVSNCNDKYFSSSIVYRTVGDVKLDPLRNFHQKTWCGLLAPNGISVTYTHSEVTVSLRQKSMLRSPPNTDSYSSFSQSKRDGKYKFWSDKITYRYFDKTISFSRDHQVSLVPKQMNSTNDIHSCTAKGLWVILFPHVY